MDIMAGARAGRAIVVYGVREAAAAGLPCRGGASAVYGTGCGRLLLRGAPSASGASHYCIHSLAAAGRNARDRNRRVSR